MTTCAICRGRGTKIYGLNPTWEACNHCDGTGLDPIKVPLRKSSNRMDKIKGEDMSWVKKGSWVIRYHPKEPSDRARPVKVRRIHEAGFSTECQFYCWNGKSASGYHTRKPLPGEVRDYQDKDRQASREGEERRKRSLDDLDRLRADGTFRVQGRPVEELLKQGTFLGRKVTCILIFEDRAEIRFEG